MEEMNAEKIQEIFRDFFKVALITGRPAEDLIREASDIVCGEFKGNNGEIAVLRGLYLKRASDFDKFQAKKRGEELADENYLPCFVLGFLPEELAGKGDLKVKIYAEDKIQSVSWNDIRIKEEDLPKYMEMAKRVEK